MRDHRAGVGDLDGTPGSPKLPGAILTGGVGPARRPSAEAIISKTKQGLVTPSALAAAVSESVGADGSLAEGTLNLYLDVWRRFASFIENGVRIADADRVEQIHVRNFLHAPRADGANLGNAYGHVRRNAVRYLYRRGRLLGLVNIDPTLDLSLPAPNGLPTRPLTDDEIGICRICAIDQLASLRLPLVWALSECTARVSEIPLVSIDGLDLEGQRVFIAGSPRTLARWAPMTEWAAAQFKRRLAAASLPSAPGSPVAPIRVQGAKRPDSAVSMAVIAVLRAAGVHGEPDVRPASVPAWAGARLLAEGARIEEVARALGVRSLDKAAAIIAYDWRAKP